MIPPSTLGLVPTFNLLTLLVLLTENRAKRAEPQVGPDLASLRGDVSASPKGLVRAKDIFTSFVGRPGILGTGADLLVAAADAEAVEVLAHGDA